MPELETYPNVPDSVGGSVNVSQSPNAPTIPPERPPEQQQQTPAGPFANESDVTPVPDSIEPNKTNYDVKHMPYPAFRDLFQQRRKYDDTEDDSMRKDMLDSLSDEQKEQFLRDPSQNAQYKQHVLKSFTPEQRLERIEAWLLHPAERVFG